MISDVEALLVGCAGGVGHGAGAHGVADDDGLLADGGDGVYVGRVRAVAQGHDDDVGSNLDLLAGVHLLQDGRPLLHAGDGVLREDLNAGLAQQGEQLVLRRAVDGGADLLLHLDDRDLVVGAEIVRDLQTDLAAADEGVALALELHATEQDVLYVIDVFTVRAGDLRHYLLAAAGDDDAVGVKCLEAGGGGGGVQVDLDAVFLHLGRLGVHELLGHLLAG